MAARLRSMTALPVKRIAARVPIGTTKGAKALLHPLARGPAHESARMNKSCAQTEFESMADPFFADGGEGRYVNFSVMCTNRTHPCIFQCLTCGWLSRGRVAPPRLAGGFRHTASVVDDATPCTDGLGAGYQLHITFDPFTGDIAIGGSAYPDHRATLKMMPPSVEALLGLDMRGLEDLTVPRTKFTACAPKTISSGSWAVRIYVNLRITKAQCLQ